MHTKMYPIQVFLDLHDFQYTWKPLEQIKCVTWRFTVWHFPAAMLPWQHQPEFTDILEDPAASIL
jgi:hypothetical protein